MRNFDCIDGREVRKVSLNVKDLNKLSDLYCNVLGFCIEKERNEERVLKMGNVGYSLSLNEVKKGGEGEFREGGLLDVGYVLGSRSDLGELVYDGKNVKMGMGGGDDVVSEGVYLSDGEGNGIEVYDDRG
ncbi:VOC family protein, partial [Staphylococcus epidermidis]